MVVSTAMMISIFPPFIAKAAGASAPFFVAAPIRLSGHVRYGVSTLFPITASPPTTTTLQTIEGSISARSRAYIWQPWFLQLSARLGVAAARSMADKSTSGLDLAGRGDILFLPRSRFPFHAYIEQQTQSPDNALFGVERLATHYGADQTFQTRRGGLYLASYNASMVSNRASLANQSSNDSFSDQANVEVFLRRPGNDLQLKGIYRREIQNSIEAKHWGRSISALHRFQPSRSFDINNIASFDHSVDKNGPSYLSSKFSQVSSGFSWRPFEKPWSVFGSVIGRQSKSGGTTTNSAAASIGGSAWMKHSEHWRSQVGASAAKAKDRQALFTQRLNSSYSNHTRFLGLGYSWSFRGGLSNRMREGENSQTYQVSAGQGMTHAIPFMGGRVNFGLNQSLSENYATTDRVIATSLGHNASMGWSTSTPLSSTQVRLSLSSSHTWGSAGRKQRSRLINLQLTRRQTLTRYSRLTASITGQAAKISTLLEGSAGYTGSLRGTVHYNHVRLFNVPNLRMSSIFAMAAKEVSPSNGLPREIDLETWETRVDYFFGKITSSLLLRVSGAKGDYYGSVSLTVARRFG